MHANSRYGAQNKAQLADAYSQWAASYDTDSASYGYRGPRAAVATLARHLAQRSARILDVGCGTGQVGELLAGEGYVNVDGVDISQVMLDVASAKRCYRSLAMADVDRLSVEAFPDDRYDCAVCVGTFTPNHVGLAGLAETLRVVRPGGLLCFSLRDDFVADTDNGFHEELTRLVSAGKTKVVEVTSPEVYTPEVSRDITFRCWVYRVTALE